MFPSSNFFLKSTWNPWEYYYVHSLPNPFPYPSLMLFILTPFQFIANLLPENYYLDNLIFKLPLLAADLVVFFILTKLFPARSKEVLALYFASPIIFYASYVHSQLDMIPTALILLALYFVIKEKPFVSSIIFGLALSTKFHVAAALPLILIYLWKKKVNPLTYLLVSIFTFGILLLPYINSIEFFNFVFKNKEQQQVLSVNFPIENLHIYLAVLVVVLIYIRFLMYSKVNKDLLFSYIGLLFACFLVFVPPMPGWYMWIIPFLFTYFINAFQFNNERIFILDAVFSLSYLLYFIFFHRTDLNDILIGGTPLHLKINSTDLKNVSYTILAGCLITVVYYLYNHGVRSNSIYKNSQQAFTIGIGGDSGVGKSTLLEDIKLLLNDKKMLEIEGDGDHKWERGDSNWEEYTHLNPKANHLHRQSEHLSSLKRGGTIERIVYDHVTGKFTSPYPYEV
ncbi:glycosyltransferase 87 family protein [Cohnella ginsengisoli]|uniref:Glycosyltransferase 87 family protein n=1 Tax=Cohnella ginsengisoli TaxID=425004 RepID=A0A9X4QQF5_9BACL|nr:glycosyltransferase 87 family protein [Cohnella ginsengisoli]MDG0794542.1 glycosyltransferase 87 family protein [Cohnella ginsengisoli]